MRKKLTLILLGAMLFTGIAPAGVSAARGQSSERKARKASVSSKARAVKKTKRRRFGRRQRGQKAPKPDRISEIQQALAREGAYSGEPTGKWDAATIEAIKRFQTSQGLNPSGKLDALTLQKLGLGSEVAGVAAPLPPPSPSANPTSPDKDK